MINVLICLGYHICFLFTTFKLSSFLIFLFILMFSIYVTGLL